MKLTLYSDKHEYFLFVTAEAKQFDIGLFRHMVRLQGTPVMLTHVLPLIVDLVQPELRYNFVVLSDVDTNRCCIPVHHRLRLLIEHLQKVDERLGLFFLGHLPVSELLLQRQSLIVEFTEVLRKPPFI